MCLSSLLVQPSAALVWPPMHALCNTYSCVPHEADTGLQPRAGVSVQTDDVSTGVTHGVVWCQPVSSIQGSRLDTSDECWGSVRLQTHDSGACVSVVADHDAIDRCPHGLSPPQMSILTQYR